MKRRELIGYGCSGLLSALMIGTSNKSLQAQTASSVTVQWLGHTCFLFTGNGVRILVNPFNTLGCTANYRLPNVEADLVLISSLLLDEGATSFLPGNPRVLSEPGVYEIKGLKFQGVSMPHDREGGRRFGQNIAWSWIQGGIKILHLGGAAAPIEIEQKILMGNPDLAIIPVGGGPKAYNPTEAVQAIGAINPKIIIPSHFLTEGADKSACDLVSVEDFLQLTKDISLESLNTDKITLNKNSLPAEGRLIILLSNRNALKSAVK